MSKFISAVSFGLLLFQTVLSKDAQEEISKTKTTQTEKQNESQEQPWYHGIPIVSNLFTPKKTIRNMSYEELKDAKNRVLAEDRKDVAVKYLEKMIPVCSDLHEKGDILLELADILFDSGELAKSELYYSQFVLLYPGDTRVWHALDRSILCSYYQIGTIDRDQTKTEQTLELIDKFLTRLEQSDQDRIAKEVEQYTKDVLKVQKECRQMLCEHELYIIDFYLKSGKYVSAQKRIKDLRNDWLPKMPNIEQALLQRELTFAQKQNNPQLKEKTEKEIAQKFPVLAHNKENTKQKHASNRF